MTQEEKDLLIKDLCARLLHGVKVLNTTYRDPEIQTLFGRVSEEEFSMKETYKQVGGEDHREVRDSVHYTGYIETIKPYLRPMSSMTEEERKELSIILNYEFYVDDDFALVAEDDRHRIRLELCEGYIDWLNAHHFDYRGLIEKGLALEAPKGMYK